MSAPRTDEHDGAAAAGPDAVSARVRPMSQDDVPAVVDLVSKQEFADRCSPEDLRRLFGYPWLPKPDCGVVLDTGDRIVGCLGVLHSTRVYDGRERWFVSGTTWYVEPEYRRYSRALLKAVLAREGCTLVALTPSDRVATILEAMHFRPVSERRLFFPPPLPALRRLRDGAEILDRGPDLEAVLSEDQRRIYRDHVRLGCRHYVVKERDGYAFVVTKRRSEKGWFLPGIAPERLRRHRYPVSDVFHVSDPAIALRHWDALRWRIVRRERTVGVAVEESFLGGLAPETTSRPHRIYAYPAETPSLWVDALYSELLLIP